MSKKILLADDDPTVINLVSKILTDQGYEVTVARDGLDVLVNVEKELPDLIVLDVMMPELNGYEVCHKLKFDEKYKNIPIILLTIREQELDPQISEWKGIEYIQKPVTTDLLLAKVNQLLEDKKS